MLQGQDNLQTEALSKRPIPTDGNKYSVQVKPNGATHRRSVSDGNDPSNSFNFKHVVVPSTIQAEMQANGVRKIEVIATDHPS